MQTKLDCFLYALLYARLSVILTASLLYDYSRSHGSVEGYYVLRL